MARANGRVKKCIHIHYHNAFTRIEINIYYVMIKLAVS